MSNATKNIDILVTNLNVLTIMI